MPKEYEACVESEKKKHSEKEAKKICAIAYYKRHGVSVNEAHKHAKKALGDTSMITIKLARSKEALLLEAKRIAKSLGMRTEDFIVLPITKELRKHPKLKSLEPDVVEPIYRYMLVQKSVDGKDFVILQTDGKLRLDFGVLPENPLAEEMNQPIRQDVPDEGKVDVDPGDSADATTKQKSVEAAEDTVQKSDDCEGDDKDCEDKPEKAEKSVLEVDREDEVADEGIVDVDSDNPKEALVQKAIEKAIAGEALTEEEAASLKALAEQATVQKSIDGEEEGKKKEVGKDFLGKIMSKVASGEELTDLERRALSAAIEATKKESGDSSSRSAKDTLGKIMSKVRKGEDLSETESKILGAAIDAAKKAKSEVAKSIMNVASAIADIEETPESIYKSMMGIEPVEGMFLFVRKSDANRFANTLKTKSIGIGVPYARTVNASERKRNIPNKYRFIVVFD